MPTYNHRAKHVTICGKTADINGVIYMATHVAWSGLRWRSAVSIGGDDPCLAVRCCYIGNKQPNAKCAWINLRSRLKGWDFVLAPNGAWILQERTAP